MSWARQSIATASPAVGALFPSALLACQTQRRRASELLTVSLARMPVFDRALTTNNTLTRRSARSAADRHPENLVGKLALKGSLRHQTSREHAEDERARRSARVFGLWGRVVPSARGTEDR